MQDTNQILHPIDEVKKQSNISVKGLTFLIVGVLVFGVLTGYLVSLITNQASSNTAKTDEKSGSNKDKAGVMDTKNFKDDAEGVLKVGGFEGEGSYHLERKGGASQNVYLTSTAVDLSEFVGKKVKVLGQTFAGEKAGWLMDVGYIETIK